MAAALLASALLTAALGGCGRDALPPGPPPAAQPAAQQPVAAELPAEPTAQPALGVLTRAKLVEILAAAGGQAETRGDRLVVELADGRSSIEARLAGEAVLAVHCTLIVRPDADVAQVVELLAPVLALARAAVLSAHADDVGRFLREAIGNPPAEATEFRGREFGGAAGARIEVQRVGEFNALLVRILPLLR